MVHQNTCWLPAGVPSPVSTKIFMFMRLRMSGSWNARTPSRIITSAGFVCRQKEDKEKARVACVGVCEGRYGLVHA